MLSVKDVCERREKEEKTYDFYRVEESGLFDVKKRGRGRNLKVFWFFFFSIFFHKFIWDIKVRER